MTSPGRRRGVIDKAHPAVAVARERVMSIVDLVPPVELVRAIKLAPSLRGMILGYLAEVFFEKSIASLEGVGNIMKHDDHDRTKNKSDRSFDCSGRRYTVQVKSIQTNSLGYNTQTGSIEADVQNDASDKRAVKIPGSKKSVTTTCYLRDEYDILAVPLFPFTGEWNFAYLRNKDCRSTTSEKYPKDVRPWLLATTERLAYPLEGAWTTDLVGLLKAHPRLGRTL
ncbi:MAG: hypothetical protein JST92_04990 [Deltaproteobacteria bacterium]|nr:hypothetical protein [Deltaproteobacteria bacterium]